MQSISKTFHKNQLKPDRTIQSLDGPPLDFSFKNLRKLQEIENIIYPNSPIKQQQTLKQTQSNVNQQMISTINLLDDQVYDAPNPKIEIVRTIELSDNKSGNQKKQLIVKKVEKQEKKKKAVIQRKTTALFLRYNKLVSLLNLKSCIQNIFPNYDQLIWIDLSHNRLVTLVEDFEAFPNLKNLYLHANFIANFKQLQKLKKCQMLRTFTIHGNPLENYPQFRVLISSLIPSLQKIDSTLLTKRQRQRGVVLIPTLKKLPIIQNPQKPPQDSDNQQDQ